VSSASATAKDSVVTPNTAESADRQRLVQKRLLEASLFGDEDSQAPKKSKQKETEDSAQTKEKTKAEKNHDSADHKASKQRTEANVSSRRSLSKTPEPTSSKHLEDGGKSSKEKHSKHTSDSHHHQSHGKHHKSSAHQSSSTTSTKQTTPPLSDGKSTTTPTSTQQSARDDGPVVADSSDKRKVSPLKLTKPSAPAASAPNQSSTQCVDMKKLFGDDDDDDDVDNVTSAAAAAPAVAVVKDDMQHKEDRHKPPDAAKKHASHGHKKTPEKSSSADTHHSAAAKTRSDKTHVQSSKTDGHSSLRSSDKRHHSDTGPEKRTRDAAKSSGKPVTPATATKPDCAPAVRTDSMPMTLSDSATISSQASHAVGNKRKREEESGSFEADLSVSDSDANDSSEVDEVDVCDSNRDKPSPPHQNHRPEAEPAAPTQLSMLSREAKAANGEYISVLLELQKQLMSVADDDTLEKLTTIIEETGKFSITDDTFDFDLCRLDINTVNKLKHFMANLATVAY